MQTPFNPITGDVLSADMVKNAGTLSWSEVDGREAALIGRCTAGDELACAELCGMNHYKMKSFMLVLPENEFSELATMPQDKFQARTAELMAKYPLPTY